MSTDEVSARPAPGDLAMRLAALSWVPLFPIGMVTCFMGMVTLARGGPRRQGWTAIVVGAFFGAVWFAMLVWLLMRHIDSP